MKLILQKGEIKKKLGKKKFFKVKIKEKAKAKVENYCVRETIMSYFKQIISISYPMNLKIYLVKLGEISESAASDFRYANQVHPGFLDQIKNLEGLEYAFVSSAQAFRFSEKKPIKYLSVAIIALRSVIGYNPSLQSMILEELFVTRSLLDVNELTEASLASSVLEEINLIFNKIVFIDKISGEQHAYLDENLSAELDQNDKFSSINVNKEEVFIVLSQQKFFSLFKNDQFNEITLFLARNVYSVLKNNESRDIKELTIFLKSVFPRQLKSVDLYALFNFIIKLK